MSPSLLLQVPLYQPAERQPALRTGRAHRDYQHVSGPACMNAPWGEHKGSCLHATLRALASRACLPIAWKRVSDWYDEMPGVSYWIAMKTITRGVLTQTENRFRCHVSTLSLLISISWYVIFPCPYLHIYVYFCLKLCYLSVCMSIQSNLGLK